MRSKKRGKIEAISLIVNLVVAIIAFSFIVGLSNLEVVGAEYPPSSGRGGVVNYNGPSNTNSGPAEKIETKQKTEESGQEKSPGPNAKTEDKAGAETPTTSWTAAPSLLGKISFGGPLIANILAGATYAAAVYGIVQLFGTMLGLEKETVNAASLALAGGIMAGHVATGIIMQWAPAWADQTGILGLTKLQAVSWGAGIGVAVLLFILLYTKTTEKLVTFECKPWEAPVEGNDCEKCNSELYPCSEYRCKSLGQACQLLNAGTNEEKCAWVHPQDVNSPIIETWEDVLTKEHRYQPNTAIRPPDRGVKIIYNKATDGCVKAFTPLTFGINVSEPAQCKIDDTRKDTFEEMSYFFGGSNTYKYNHSQTLSLPSPEAVNAEAPELKSNGVYNFYVRCMDANGNANDDLFVFSFCVEAGPDVTPPVIVGTSIANNMPFQFGLNETELEVYTNEPAECKWSREVDRDYKTMENIMTCPQHIYEMNNLMLYKCTTKLTDLEDYKDNVFYFKCRDQPLLKGTDKENDRMTNQESYKFILKGTQPLNIADVKPNGTITGYSTLANVYLEVKTENGYNLGDSWCSYSTTGEADDWIEMAETGTNLHKQRQDLSSGTYTYYFQCVDLGGNADTASTTFKVEIDNTPPVVVRVYKDGTKLKIVTDERSTCSYNTNTDKACNFAIDEGTNMPGVDSTEHLAEWLDGKTYYVKCKDSNEVQPLPTECSIVVKTES